QAAAAALSAVLSILQPKGIEAMRVVWKEYWKTLKRLIKEDPRRDVTPDYIIAVDNCTVKLGKEVRVPFKNFHIDKYLRIFIKGITVDEMNEIGVMIMEKMEEETRMMEQLTGRGENIGVLDKIAELVVSLFKTMGTSFCQYIIPAMSLFFPLIDSSVDKSWGVHFISALFRFAPDVSFPVHQQIVQLLFPLLHDEISQNRTSAAHVFGLMAHNNRPEWKMLAVQSLESLCEMCCHTDARTAPYNFATDNAISSICKIVQNCGQFIGREKMMSKLLLFLPIREDREEGVIVYSFIADLIE
ncbi:hypothetical protein PMAYCL1PPCAC_24393, partial [Pristionchus mayeri]